MSHSSHASSETSPRWLRWILAVLVVATVGLGGWGNWLVEKRHAEEARSTPKDEHADQTSEMHSVDLASIIYHACQLLVAHGAHVEGEVPWQLHWGRFLGLASIFTVGALAVLKFFHAEGNALSVHAPWRRRHVVICGLGDLGLRLGLDARDRGKFVVAIEKNGAHGIEEARRRGIVIIEGEACSESTLRRARVHRAEYLIAACEDDATNVAIAALSKQIASKQKDKHRLVCRLLLRDEALRQSLKTHRVLDSEVAGHSNGGRPFQTNFSDLNLQETAARQAIRKFPLDFELIRENDSTVVHLVIIGAGSMGEHLALQAVRTGLFANSVDTTHRMKLTFVDTNSKVWTDSFCDRNPAVRSLCDVNHLNIDCQHSTGMNALAELSKGTNQQVTLAVCFSNVDVPCDDDNLRIGIELAELTRGTKSQTLTYQHSRRGFAALFQAECAGLGPYQRLHAFGMVEDIYSWDVLLHESEDRIARALHEDYVEKNRQIGKPWDKIDDGMKDSNRHAADHIAIKLRAIGYHESPLDKNKTRLEHFEEEDLKLLAKLEHQRWCAERLLAGWKYATDTDRTNKLSQDIVPWEKLSPKEKKKDYDQINAIPSILFKNHKGIYRKVGYGPTD